MSQDTIEAGVYRNGFGHTMTITKRHPEEVPIPSPEDHGASGYIRIASLEEFEKGEFHPYALPGEEPDGWSPEAPVHAAPQAIVFNDAAPAEVDPADLKKAVGDATKTLKADHAKEIAGLQKQLDELKAGMADTVNQAVVAAVEAATK